MININGIIIVGKEEEIYDRYIEAKNFFKQSKKTDIDILPPLTIIKRDNIYWFIYAVMKEKNMYKVINIDLKIYEDIFLFSKYIEDELLFNNFKYYWVKENDNTKDEIPIINNEKFIDVISIKDQNNTRLWFI